MPQRIPLLATALLLAASVVAVEPELVVTQVEIQGARRVHASQVTNLLSLRPGKVCTPSQLQEALADDTKAIERMGPFTAVRGEVHPSEDGRSVRVSFTFRELPWVAELRFETFDRITRDRRGRVGPWQGEGAWEYAPLSYFRREEFEKRITTRVGGSLNPLLVESDRRALLRLLQDQGYRNARVEVEQREVDGDIVLIFRIDQGSTLKVGKVIIEGLPEGVTPRAFELSAANPLGLVNAEGQPYQADLVGWPGSELGDAAGIARTLQDLGWLGARVTAVRREITDYVRPTDERSRQGPTLVPDGEFNDRVVLVYTVEAGRRYTLGSVSFVGNTVAGADELRRAFRLDEGAWFTRTAIWGWPGARGRGDDEALGAIERARRVISNRGHARCRFDADRRLDDLNHVVHLVIHVDEGSRYRIGRVDISGNQVTRDAVVRRALALAPGDQWSDDEADESVRQIERTGLFASSQEARRGLRITPRFPQERPEECDLLVEVDERSSGQLNFSVGYSTASGIFGSFGYTERSFDLLGMLRDPAGIPSARSFRGGGETLSLNLYGSEDRKSISSSWSTPHLLDGPFWLSLGGFRSDSSSYEWREKRTGGTVSIGRNFLRNDLQIGLTYGYTDLGVSEITRSAPDDVEEGHHYFNFFGLSQTYDRLNDRQNPTSGYILAASQTAYGIPLSASEPFAELTGKASAFVPLWRSDDGGVTFLRLTGRWRHLEPIDGNDLVPYYARIRGGGPSPAHRGFDSGKLSPTAINSRTEAGITGFLSRIGGTEELLFTGELSYPIQGLNDGIRLVGFIDYGQVWAQDQSVNLRDLRSAAGFGVRLPPPLAVALDFAWLLERKAGEDSGLVVQFNMGQTIF